MERRLAAIVSADVVGYSRLMGEDEAGTLERPKALRAAAIDPLIAEHNGRIVKLMGDGALVEFASVVDAVACAVAIQRAVAAAHADVEPARRIELRIGVNLGDVIVEGDDIYGDGVNVAARLQEIAEPGGVRVSGTVFDHVGERLAVAFTDLGEQTVKNIARPVRVYRVADAAGAGGPAAGYAGDPALPDKPSIAVLPFTNMSGDPEQEYFADGITEDIITELSRFEGLLVIARNSTFRFKGQAIDVGEVGRALGVRYVLEGGVRRSGGRVRITAQLIDVSTGGHLWAKRYDRELTDIFAVQDDVTRQIVMALKSELGEATATRPGRPLTANHRAYDLFLRGRSYKERRTQQAMVFAEELFQRAIELDPIFAAAYAELAHTGFLNFYYGWREGRPKLDGAEAAAEKAVILDPSLALAHARLAHIRAYQGRLDQGIASARRGVALDANYAEAYGTLSLMLNFDGDTEGALAMADMAGRLDPYSYIASYNKALAHFIDEDYEPAIAASRAALTLNPDYGVAHQLLAATYGLLDRDVEARAAAAEVLRLSPNFAEGTLRRPFKDRAILIRMIDGLRKAGLDIPEAPPEGAAD